MNEKMIQINPVLAEMKLQDYLEDNTIYLDDEVHRDSQVLFCRQMRKLREKELGKSKKDRKPIKIFISSYGGNVDDFYAMASEIERTKRLGIIVETYCMGYVCSAGFKLFILGSRGHRYVTKYAMLMVHQIQLTEFGRKTLQERYVETDNLKKHWEVIKDIIRKNTKLTEEELDDLTNKNMDVEFTAQEAIAKGIADKIYG